MGKQLVAFALVADEVERTGDPIKGLRPLFAPLLSGRSGQEFDAEKFASDFSEIYGLKMSTFVARALSERLEEIGLLTRSYDVATGEKFRVADFEWNSEAIQEHQIEQTITLFVAWAQKQTEVTEIRFSDAQLEAGLLSRLSRPEFASIFTRAAEDKTKRLRGMLGISGLEVAPKSDAYLDFLVAQFLLEAAQKAPDVFFAISQISYGSLLADAVAGLALPDVTDGGVSHEDFFVVLDGPIVLDLLNLNSREHMIYAEGLLDIIRRSGIRVGVFEHSLEEMKHTIDATLASDARGEGFGPMAHRFRTEQGQRAYAALVRDSLRKRVGDLGIEFLVAEHYRSPAYFKFFPEQRVDDVRNSIGDLHAHVDARARDAESVAAVARMKGARGNAESIFDSVAIFVTRNSVLCKRVLRTLARGYSDPMPRFTIATDGQLAGVLWFVSGIEGLDLSRKRLIANCSAAILPGKEVVARIAAFLEGVRPELKADFEALMADSRASLCTMRLTGGDPDQIDEAKALEIVEAMRKELAAPALERANAAEMEAALARQEAAKASNEARQVVETIQNNMNEVEGRRAEEVKRFDLTIADFSMKLEVAEGDLRETRRREEERVSDALRKISSCESALKRKVDLVFRFLEFIAVILIAASAFLDIWGDVFTGIWVKIVLSLVALLTIGVVEKFLKNRAKLLIRRMFRSDQRYIDGLKAGLGL